MKVNFTDQQVTRTFSIFHYFPNIWRYCNHTIFFQIYERNYSSLYDLEVTLYHQGFSKLKPQQIRLFSQLSLFYDIVKQYYQKDFIPPKHLSDVDKKKIRYIKQYNKNIKFDIAYDPIYNSYLIRKTLNHYQYPQRRNQTDVFLYNQRVNFGNKKLTLQYRKQKHSQKLLLKDSKQKAKLYENKFDSLKILLEYYGQDKKIQKPKQVKKFKNKFQIFLNNKQIEASIRGQLPYFEVLKELKQQWKYQEQQLQEKAKLQKQRSEEIRKRKQFYYQAYEGCQIPKLKYHKSPQSCIPLKNYKRDQRQYISKFIQESEQEKEQLLFEQIRSQISEQFDSDFFDFEIKMQVMENKEQMVEKVNQNVYSINDLKEYKLLMENNEIQNLTQSVVNQCKQVNSWQRILKKVLKPKQSNIKIGQGHKNQNNKNSHNNQKKQYNVPEVLGIGSKFKKDTFCSIMLGKNISKETVKKKQELLNQARRINYAKQQQQKIYNLIQIQQKKIQIAYQLNKITPESLDYIFQQLKQYVINSEEECKILIDIIFQKAISQTKYAQCYASLCAKLAQIDTFQYKYQSIYSRQPKKTVFRCFLYEKAQALVFKNQNGVNSELNEQQKINQKKQMIGHIQFVAQLIKKRKINIKITSQVLVCFLRQFLKQYNLYQKYNKIENSIYLYQFQYIIRFLQILGQDLQRLNQVKFIEQDYNFCKNYISQYCDGNPIFSAQQFLKAAKHIHFQNFFQLFHIIDTKILILKDNRLSSLLKNLIQRCQKKWAKHHAELDVPKKLNSFNSEYTNQKQQNQEYNDIANQQFLAVLSSQMKTIIKQFQNKNQRWKFLLQQMIKNRKIEYIYFTFFRVAPEEIIQKIEKTLQIFKYLLDNNFNVDKFQKGWKSVIKVLAYEFTDIPFCSALMAKALVLVKQKKNINWKNYFITFDEQNQQDQKFYMDETYQKLYYYSKDKSILKFVEENKNLKKLL